MTSLPSLIDVQRYPLDALDSPAGTALIDDCREMLARTGACQLHGFVRPAVVDQMAAEARELCAGGHRTDDTHNVYFETIDETPPETDVRRHLERSSKLTAGYDRMAPESPLRALYENDAMTEFVGRCLDLAEFYRDADPAGALSYASFGPGDELGWHFDRSEFAVTLMLQPTPEGGVYEYVQDLRTPEDENHAGVAAVLAGRASDAVVTLRNEPGTFSMFRGRYSIHRVTPNRSQTPRLNAVLAYATVPDHVLNTVTRELFYGTA